MKNKNLVCSFALVLFAHFALAKEPTLNAATRTAITEAISRREAPGSSREAGRIQTAERVKSGGPQMPLFYSMQCKVPPLPFNPFPELPVYKLETDKFAYDDR